MATDTDTSPAPIEPTRGEIDAKLAERWPWFVALGVLYMLLAGVGLGAIGLLSLVSVVMIAALFLVGGVGQLIHAFRCPGWRSTVLHVLGAALYVVAGAMLLAQPVFGLVTLTLVVGAIIFATGITRIVIGAQHRPGQGWTWLVLSGLIGVVLGLLILAGLPGNAIWVLGLFVAIELLMEGWSMVLMGLALRRWKQREAAG
jgi:uncharacterized membrane protein HdeD (DUF308 family)